MNREELQNKLDELTRSIDQLCEQFGISKESLANIDLDGEDDEDYDEDDDDDYDEDDIDAQPSGIGVGLSLNLPFSEDFKRLDECFLAEPDEDGMVEIPDDLYEKYFSKYHSKEDMLSDLIRTFDYYISGKYMGYAGYWDYVYHLGISKTTNKPQIRQDKELDDEDYDLYDLSEFDQCYWTNIDDPDAEIFEYKLIDDKPLRDLVDKYYPDLEW